MHVHLKTLGCRLNEAELEAWARDFRARGFELATTAEHADLIVINTCAVTDEAVRKSRKLLRRVHRENPSAKLVVSGCYSSLDLSESQALPGVDLVVENRHKDRLPEMVSEALDLHATPLAGTEPGENLLFARGRQRAFIKVQDGCRYRCTYCIVTLARGEERSRPIGDILAQIHNLTEENVREIVLTGVHLGGYGANIGSNLVELVTAILAETSIPRVRLGSLEPWDILPDFWELFANPRLMPHLHLPVQSGADTVLRRMARRGRRGDFLRLAAEGRQQVPALNITTDIIVGFPGETPDEFRDSLDLVEQAEFSHVHIFSFSPRRGTKATTLPEPVPDEVRRARSATLHALADEMRQRVLARWCGTRQPVLVERITAATEVDSDDSQPSWQPAWGYTPNFLRVAVEVPPGAVDENDIIDVELTGTHADGHLLGRWMDRGRFR